MVNLLFAGVMCLFWWILEDGKTHKWTRAHRVALGLAGSWIILLASIISETP